MACDMGANMAISEIRKRVSEINAIDQSSAGLIVAWALSHSRIVALRVFDELIAAPDRLSEPATIVAEECWSRVTECLLRDAHQDIAERGIAIDNWDFVMHRFSRHTENSASTVIEYLQDEEMSTLLMSENALEIPSVLTTANDIGASAAAIMEIATANGSFVSLDTEWKILYAAGHAKTSVISIACPDLTTVIYHIGRLSELPKPLVDLLESASISKIGNNILADMTRLTRDFAGLRPRNIVDLQHVSYEVGLTDVKRIRLQVLMSILFGLTIDKGSVRKSDWSTPELTEEQRNYVALDGNELYVVTCI
jgi:hypothetical protein